jgi:hypothetical protein
LDKMRSLTNFLHPGGLSRIVGMVVGRNKTGLS